MKWVPLSGRVAAAFDGDAASTFGDQYLTILLDNWRDVARSLRRGLVLVVALMVGFFLLQDAKNTSFSLGPLRLTNVSAVLTGIPVLVAVLGYECLSYISAYTLYRDIVTEVIKKIHPSIYDNDLHLTLAPSTLSILGGIGPSWEDVRESKPGVSQTLLTSTSFGIFLFIFVGIFGFLTYAFWHLYADPHANGLAVSISLLVSVLYVVRAIAFSVHAP